MKMRMIKYDFMRSIAVIGVVLGHSLALAADVTENMVIAEKYLTVFMRPVVPIFLFLAGVFYKPRQKVRDLVLRSARILMPYLFFAAVFTLIYAAGHVKYRPLNFLLRILVCEVHPIYYYVFVMVECMAIMFLYEKLFRYDRMLVPLFLTALVLSLLHGNFSKEIMEMLHMKADRVMFFTYRSPFLWFVYYAAGLVYKQYPVIEKKLLEYRRYVWTMLAGLGIFYCVMRGFEIGDLDPLNSVITTLICFATIMAFLTIEVRSEKWIFLSRRSFTVYLAHVPFYYFMTVFWKSHPNTSAWAVVLVNAAVMSCGVILVYGIGKAALKEKSFYIMGS